MKLGIALIILMAVFMTAVYSQRFQYHRPGMRPPNMMKGIMQVYRPRSYPKKFLIIPTGNKNKQMMIRFKKPKTSQTSKGVKNPKSPQNSQKTPTKYESIEIWPKKPEEIKNQRKFFV